MTTTYMDIVNKVLLEIDEDEVNSTEFAANGSNELIRVKNYVNDIYRDIINKGHEWSWMTEEQTFNTVADQAGYTSLSATTDYQNIYSLQINNYSPMVILPHQEFKRRYGDDVAVTTNRPHTAYTVGDKLYLYPTPDQVYTINVINKKLYTALSLYDDEPFIPEGNRHVLFQGAAWLAKEKDNETSHYGQMYIDGLKSMIARDDNSHIGHSIQPEELVYAEQLARIDDEAIRY